MPWSVGLYHSKRVVHKTDLLGAVEEEEDVDNLVALPGWNREGKLRLAKTCVARELGVSMEAVSARLDALCTLLPELGERFTSMREGDLARLAVVPDVAATLIRLRATFPRANIGRMVARRPDLLLMEAQDLEERAAGLRALLPGLDADAAAAEQPRLLDLASTRTALAELQRLMPDANVARMLVNDPSMLSSVDTGDDLILYDNGSVKQLQASLRARAGSLDEADASPEGW
jgi:hypothetical protein